MVALFLRVQLPSTCCGSERIEKPSWRPRVARQLPRRLAFRITGPGVDVNERSEPTRLRFTDLLAAS